MNKSTNNAASSTRPPESETGDADQRRELTLTRIRSALLQDKLSVMSLTNESAGTDPYNSGVHLALGKATAWNKRTRR